MSADRTLPDLVHDSKIETSVTGNRVEHVFYEPGRSPHERRRRRVEHWTRDVILGKGAYGIVYREKQDKGNTQVFRAVKEISKSVVHGEQLDYIRELEAVMKFSHQKYSHCFVRSDGWFEKEDSIFIAMEHIELGDLQRHLTQPLPEAEAMEITAQILEGLNFMHDNGFVHRDLKPGNIMVVSKGPQWFVKIADFGISKRRQQGVTTLHTLQRGTLGFAAPEVLGFNPNSGGNGGSYTFAVDMWSLGAVAYYILTNAMVFENSVAIIMYAMGAAQLPVAALEAKHVSESARGFLSSLLAPLPEGRPTASVAAKHEWLAAASTRVTEDAQANQSIQEATENPEMLTMVSEASVAWSVASSSSSFEDKTIRTDDQVHYRPPQIEDVGATQKIDAIGHLPADHPHVLEDAAQQQSHHEATQHLEVGEQQTLRSPSGQDSSQGEQLELPSRPYPDAEAYDPAEIEPAPALPMPSETDPKVESPSQVRLPAEKTIESHGATSLVYIGKEDSDSYNESSYSYDEYESDASDSSTSENQNNQQDRVFHAAYLNFRRETLYFRKLVHHFVDAEGNIWHAPSSRTPKDHNHWRQQESLGHARLLFHVERELDHAGYTRTSEMCFACQRSILQSEIRELPCGHLHCNDCLEWAFRFSATDARIRFPECCAELISFSNLRERISSEYQALSEAPKLVNCLNRHCRKAFTAPVSTRSPRTGEWMVLCPWCSSGVCWPCGGACGNKTRSYGCPSREKFRDILTKALLEQDPTGRVLMNDSWVDPGLRLDPTTTTETMAVDRALPGMNMSSTRGYQSQSLQETTTRAIIEANRGGECVQCGQLEPFPGSVELLACGHAMCHACITQWFAIGLVSPVHVTPLCPVHSSSHATGPLHSVFRSIGIDSGLIAMWKKNGQLRLLANWKCPVKRHAIQLLDYGLDRPMSWKQECRECALSYCLCCNLPWHKGGSSLCENARAARAFCEWLKQMRYLTDARTFTFIRRALISDGEKRRMKVKTSTKRSSYTDLRMPADVAADSETRSDASEGEDSDVPLFVATIKHSPDRFSLWDGRTGSATRLEGLTRAEVEDYLDALPR